MGRRVGVLQIGVLLKQVSTCLAKFSNPFDLVPTGTNATGFLAFWKFYGVNEIGSGLFPQQA